MVVEHSQECAFAVGRCFLLRARTPGNGGAVAEVEKELCLDQPEGVPVSLYRVQIPSSDTNLRSPGFLNSLAGLISTVVNIITAQKGILSTTAIISVTVTSVLVAVNGGLWGMYHLYLLKKVQEQHYESYGYVKPRKNKSQENVAASF